MDKIDYKYEQFIKALGRLEEAVGLDFPTIETKHDSAIQRFEFTVELFWKSLKELLNDRGVVVNSAPIDVIRAAKAAGYLADDDVYVKMIRDRNLTSHVNDDAMAAKIYDNVKGIYIGALRRFVEGYEK